MMCDATPGANAGNGGSGSTSGKKSIGSGPTPLTVGPGGGERWRLV